MSADYRSGILQPYLRRITNKERNFQLTTGIKCANDIFILNDGRKTVLPVNYAGRNKFFEKIFETVCFSGRNLIPFPLDKRYIFDYVSVKKTSEFSTI